MYMCVYTCMHTTGSGDLLAENFNPAWFLLEKYRFSTFEVLYANPNVCMCVHAYMHTCVCVCVLMCMDCMCMCVCTYSCAWLACSYRPGAEGWPGQAEEGSEEERKCSCRLHAAEFGRLPTLLPDPLRYPPHICTHIKDCYLESPNTQGNVFHDTYM